MRRSVSVKRKSHQIQSKECDLLIFGGIPIRIHSTNVEVKSKHVELINPEQLEVFGVKFNWREIGRIFFHLNTQF